MRRTSPFRQDFKPKPVGTRKGPRYHFIDGIKNQYGIHH